MLENLKAVLKAAGLTLSDVIKTTELQDDVSDFGVVNEIYETYFNDSKPARSCVEAGALPKGALIEIEVIAAKIEIKKLSLAERPGRAGFQKESFLFFCPKYR